MVRSCSLKKNKKKLGLCDIKYKLHDIGYVRV